MALPGIDLPLDQNFELPTEDANGNWQQRAIPLIVRERVTLDLMAVLKNKSGWEKEIFDNAIVDNGEPKLLPQATRGVPEMSRRQAKSRVWPRLQTRDRESFRKLCSNM